MNNWEGRRLGNIRYSLTPAPGILNKKSTPQSLAKPPGTVSPITDHPSPEHPSGDGGAASADIMALFMPTYRIT